MAKAAEEEGWKRTPGAFIQAAPRSVTAIPSHLLKWASPLKTTFFCPEYVFLLYGCIRLGNQWTDDSYMQEILRRYCPDSIFKDIIPDLTAFGEVVYTCFHFLI